MRRGGSSGEWNKTIRACWLARNPVPSRPFQTSHPPTREVRPRMSHNVPSVITAMPDVDETEFGDPLVKYPGYYAGCGNARRYTAALVCAVVRQRRQLDTRMKRQNNRLREW